MAKNVSKADQPESPRAKAETRIDRPHAPLERAEQAGARSVATPANAEVPVGDAGSASSDTPNVAIEQARLQATQLASHLRARQADLDCREAQVNARLARVDSHVRRERLWLSERDEELKARSGALYQRERQLEERLARLAAAEGRADEKHRACGDLATREQALRQGQLELEASEAELARREAAHQHALSQWQSEKAAAENALRWQRQQIDAQREASLEVVRRAMAGLEKRRAALESHLETLRDRASQPSPQVLAEKQAVRQSARGLELRRQELERAESELAALRAETESLRDQLVEDRRNAAEEAHALRQKLAAEHRRAMEDLDAKRKALARQGEHVDQCHASLKELRAELERMHRETLEIRLATEELWVQLSGVAPPAALTRSLGQIRARLAEHYRLASDDLCAQQRELDAIRGQLTRQREKLVAEKDRLKRWSARRDEEIQSQAERLVSREQELQSQQVELADLARKWQAERLGYRHEIRKLRDAVRRREPAAVA